jgi:hypothetical protein
MTMRNGWWGTGARAAAAVLLLAGIFATPVRAATLEEDAMNAAREWVKAVTAYDVDTQMNLLPKRLYASPESRERAKQMRLHDKEMAKINREKIHSFEIQAPSATSKIGKMTLVIIPYRSVVENEKTGKIERSSSLLAIAEEGNPDWAVMDGSGQSFKSLKFVLPGYSGHPRIPPSLSKVVKD